MSCHGNDVQDCGVDEVGRYMDHAVSEKLRGKKVGKDADEAGKESPVACFFILIKRVKLYSIYFKKEKCNCYYLSKADN